jgi:hypothetical protein
MLIAFLAAFDLFAEELKQHEFELRLWGTSSPEALDLMEERSEFHKFLEKARSIYDFTFQRVADSHINGSFLFTFIEASSVGKSVLKGSGVTTLRGFGLSDQVLNAKEKQLLESGELNSTFVLIGETATKDIVFVGPNQEHGNCGKRCLDIDRDRLKVWSSEEAEEFVARLQREAASVQERYEREFRYLVVYRDNEIQYVDCLVCDSTRERYALKHETFCSWSFNDSGSLLELEPSIVDKQGNFYGFLTLNPGRPGAVSFASDLRAIYERSRENPDVVRKRLCEALGYIQL